MYEDSRIAHFPVSFFAMVMGLSGLSLAWHRLESVLGLALPVSRAIAMLAALVFVIMAATLILKIIRYPDMLKADLKHPIKLHFFPAISISMILLCILAHQAGLAITGALFVAGAGLHLLLMLYVLHNWFNHAHFQTIHLNPAWFIPAVGNVLVPIAGVDLGYIELSWFFFAIGLLFWIVLFTIIFNRVLFHDPLPDKLAPTLFILIAPPAIGFIAYVKLTSGVDGFARILYYAGLFLTLFLLTQFPRLMRLPFSLSGWAFSFPLAAISIASWVMSSALNSQFLQWVAIALTGLASVVIGFLFVRTLMATFRGQICQPE